MTATWPFPNAVAGGSGRPRRAYLAQMAGLPTAFVDALRDRYVIEREIGAGGMATVHLARDVRHRRPVAIKVLAPDLAASLGAERFLKEIEIAARLTHPHIVPLHDSGQAAGLLYYVMPFIEGESLRARLRREHHLETAEALRITAAVGDALGYAHGRGILHRDIKPENILFAAGHPMVADFGIARAVSTAGSGNITRTGLALGTPGYMSPEQAAGERDLDARTDVYSLGCVLYEMLAGEPPAMWQSDAAMQAERLSDVPERHRARVEAMGAVIEGALVHALALRARDRFGSVDAFLRALRATPGAAPRRFSEREVDAIVRHAAEEQLAHPTAEGMSLETVRQIARDVGLSPERIERAARRVAVRPPGGTGLAAGSGADALATAADLWLGSSTLIAADRVVEGEVGTHVYDDVVEEVQATLATVGETDTLGRALHWRTEKPVLGKRRAVQVRVLPRDGQTRIHVEERLTEHAWSLFTPIAVGGGLGGLAIILSLGGPEFGWFAASAAGAGWLGAMYALGRKLFGSVARRKRADLEALSARLAEISASPDRGRLERGAPPTPAE